MKKTTVFGTKKAIKSPVPLWVKYALTITVILTAVAYFVISGDPGISDSAKVRIGNYLKGVDLFVTLIAPLFGVAITKPEVGAKD